VPEQPEAFADPRSLAAIDAADLYEAGEIDEPVYQAAVQAAVRAAEEAEPASGLRRGRGPRAAAAHPSGASPGPVLRSRSFAMTAAQLPARSRLMATTSE